MKISQYFSKSPFKNLHNRVEKCYTQFMPDAPSFLAIYKYIGKKKYQFGKMSEEKEHQRTYPPEKIRTWYALIIL